MPLGVQKTEKTLLAEVIRESSIQEEMSRFLNLKTPPPLAFRKRCHLMPNALLSPPCARWLTERRNPYRSPSGSKCFLDKYNNTQKITTNRIPRHVFKLVTIVLAKWVVNSAACCETIYLFLLWAFHSFIQGKCCQSIQQHT